MNMSDFLEMLRGISPILVCLLVCGAKIVEITIQSLKTCMMVKGQRLKAAGLGFVEVVVLENVADIAVSDHVGVFPDALVFDGQRALCKAIQTANDVEQCRFTASAFTENRNHSLFGKLD